MFSGVFLCVCENFPMLVVLQKKSEIAKTCRIHCFVVTTGMGVSLDPGSFHPAPTCRLRPLALLKPSSICISAAHISAQQLLTWHKVRQHQIVSGGVDVQYQSSPWRRLLSLWCAARKTCFRLILRCWRTAWHNLNDTRTQTSCFSCIVQPL